jgi:hypothetical protein
VRGCTDGGEAGLASRLDSKWSNFAGTEKCSASAVCLPQCASRWMPTCSLLKRGLLALDTYLRSIRFITFVRQCFLRRGPQRLFVGILRQIAVAANHLFACLDANQPLRLAGIPGNFHSIGLHGFAPFRSPQYTRQFIAFGAYQAQSRAAAALSSLNPPRRAPCSDQSRCGP